MVAQQLNKRLLRDLASTKSQVVSIALIVAVGIGVLVGFSSTHSSLKKGRNKFYLETNFADIFADIKNAPSSIAERIRASPNVQTVDTGLAFEALIQVPGMEEPAVGQFLSFSRPDVGLNRVRIIAGRIPSPTSSNEVLVSEGFLAEHGLRFGDRLVATLNGQYRELTIVGSAVSPEHMIALQPGSAFPDNRHFSLVWMNHVALAESFAMGQGFNRLSVVVSRQANPQRIIDQLETILAPYGAIRVYSREDQISFVYLNEELNQLRVQARFVPLLFFLVAAFILNVVISRRINAQRSEIATLKALGYYDREIAGYYLKFAALVVLLGSVIGVILGWWIGHTMTELYSVFYHIPTLVYEFRYGELAIAMASSFAVALIGTYSALRRIFTMAPAEAMRPPAPINYHSRLFERSAQGLGLSLRVKMALRGILSVPLRSFMTAVGASFAIVLLVSGLFWGDSLDFLIEVQYSFIQRETASLQLVQPLGPGVVTEVARLPGVLEAEGYHNVPVKVRNGSKEVSTSIIGMPTNARLFNPVDDSYNPIRIPEGQILLSQILANQLDVTIGDIVELEAVVGKRPRLALKVSRVAESFMSSGAFTSRTFLADWLKQGDRVNQVLLRASTDPAALYMQLKQFPHVLSVNYKDSALRMFHETSAKFLLLFAFILSTFAGVISFGISYNNIQIALAERDWELATLRIQGFYVGEVFWILVAEMSVIIILAIPLGCVLGYLSAKGLLTAMSMDAFIIPFVISPATYLMSTAVLLTGAAVGLAGAYFRLQKMDPGATLKSRG